MGGVGCFHWVCATPHRAPKICMCKYKGVWHCCYTYIHTYYHTMIKILSAIDNNTGAEVTQKLGNFVVAQMATIQRGNPRELFQSFEQETGISLSATYADNDSQEETMTYFSNGGSRNRGHGRRTRGNNNGTRGGESTRRRLAGVSRLNQQQQQRPQTPQTSQPAGTLHAYRQVSGGGSPSAEGAVRHVVLFNNSPNDVHAKVSSSSSSQQIQKGEASTVILTIGEDIVVSDANTHQHIRTITTGNISLGGQVPVLFVRDCNAPQPTDKPLEKCGPQTPIYIMVSNMSKERINCFPIGKATPNVTAAPGESVHLRSTSGRWWGLYGGGEATDDLFFKVPFFCDQPILRIVVRSIPRRHNDSGHRLAFTNSNSASLVATRGSDRVLVHPDAGAQLPFSKASTDSDWTFMRSSGGVLGTIHTSDEWPSETHVNFDEGGVFVVALGDEEEANKQPDHTEPQWHGEVPCGVKKVTVNNRSPWELSVRSGDSEVPSMKVPAGHSGSVSVGVKEGAVEKFYIVGPKDSGVYQEHDFSCGGDDTFVYEIVDDSDACAKSTMSVTNSMGVPIRVDLYGMGRDVKTLQPHSPPVTLRAPAPKDAVYHPPFWVVSNAHTGDVIKRITLDCTQAGHNAVVVRAHTGTPVLPDPKPALSTSPTTATAATIPHDDCDCGCDLKVLTMAVGNDTPTTVTVSWNHDTAPTFLEPGAVKSIMGTVGGGVPSEIIFKGLDGKVQNKVAVKCKTPDCAPIVTVSGRPAPADMPDPRKSCTTVCKDTCDLTAKTVHVKNSTKQDVTVSDDAGFNLSVAGDGGSATGEVYVKGDEVTTVIVRGEYGNILRIVTFDCKSPSPFMLTVPGPRVEHADGSSVVNPCAPKVVSVDVYNELTQGVSVSWEGSDTSATVPVHLQPGQHGAAKATLDASTKGMWDVQGTDDHKRYGVIHVDCDSDGKTFYVTAHGIVSDSEPKGDPKGDGSCSARKMVLSVVNDMPFDVEANESGSTVPTTVPAGKTKALASAVGDGSTTLWIFTQKGNASNIVGKKLVDCTYAGGPYHIGTPEGCASKTLTFMNDMGGGDLLDVKLTQGSGQPAQTAVTHGQEITLSGTPANATSSIQWDVTQNGTHVGILQITCDLPANAKINSSVLHPGVPMPANPVCELSTVTLDLTNTTPWTATVFWDVGVSSGNQNSVATLAPGTKTTLHGIHGEGSSALWRAVLTDATSGKVQGTSRVMVPCGTKTGVYSLTTEDDNGATNVAGGVGCSGTATTRVEVTNDTAYNYNAYLSSSPEGKTFIKAGSTKTLQTDIVGTETKSWVFSPVGATLTHAVIMANRMVLNVDCRTCKHKVSMSQAEHGVLPDADAMCEQGAFTCAAGSVRKVDFQNTFHDTLLVAMRMSDHEIVNIPPKESRVLDGTVGDGVSQTWNIHNADTQKVIKKVILTCSAPSNPVATVTPAPPPVAIPGEQSGGVCRETKKTLMASNKTGGPVTYTLTFSGQTPQKPSSGNIAAGGSQTISAVVSTGVQATADFYAPNRALVQKAVMNCGSPDVVYMSIEDPSSSQPPTDPTKCNIGGDCFRPDPKDPGVCEYIHDPSIYYRAQDAEDPKNVEALVDGLVKRGVDKDCLGGKKDPKPEAAPHDVLPGGPSGAKPAAAHDSTKSITVDFLGGQKFQGVCVPKASPPLLRVELPLVGGSADWTFAVSGAVSGAVPGVDRSAAFDAAAGGGVFHKATSKAGVEYAEGYFALTPGQMIPDKEGKVGGAVFVAPGPKKSKIPHTMVVCVDPCSGSCQKANTNIPKKETRILRPNTNSSCTIGLDVGDVLIVLLPAVTWAKSFWSLENGYGEYAPLVGPMEEQRQNGFGFFDEHGNGMRKFTFHAVKGGSKTLHFEADEETPTRVPATITVDVDIGKFAESSCKQDPVVEASHADGSKVVPPVHTIPTYRPSAPPAVPNDPKMPGGVVPSVSKPSSLQCPPLFNAGERVAYFDVQFSDMEGKFILTKMSGGDVSQGGSENVTVQFIKLPKIADFVQGVSVVGVVSQSPHGYSFEGTVPVSTSPVPGYKTHNVTVKLQFYCKNNEIDVRGSIESPVLPQGMNFYATDTSTAGSSSKGFSQDAAILSVDPSQDDNLLQQIDVLLAGGVPAPVFRQETIELDYASPTIASRGNSSSILENVPDDDAPPPATRSFQQASQGGILPTMKPYHSLNMTTNN
jgi:hypothetical protein